MDNYTYIHTETGLDISWNENAPIPVHTDQLSLDLDGATGRASTFLPHWEERLDTHAALGASLTQVLDDHQIPLDCVFVLAAAEAEFREDFDVWAFSWSDGEDILGEEYGVQWRDFTGFRWFVYSTSSRWQSSLTVGVVDGFQDDPDVLVSIDDALDRLGSFARQMVAA